MPISREEFEKGKPDPALPILKFLRSNPDIAFSLEQLYDIVLSSQIDLDIEALEMILRSLESQGKIETKKIDNVVYYISYRKPIGFVPRR
jgi:hypothetical protein